MLYDIQVNVQGSRTMAHQEATKIQAQNVFESFLADGVDFTMTVKEHVHDHHWSPGGRRMDGDVDFTCDGCEETFGITQTLLTACFAGKLKAREHGF